MMNLFFLQRWQEFHFFRKIHLKLIVWSKEETWHSTLNFGKAPTTSFFNKLNFSLKIVYQMGWTIFTSSVNVKAQLPLQKALVSRKSCRLHRKMFCKPTKLFLRTPCFLLFQMKFFFKTFETGALLSWMKSFSRTLFHWYQVLEADLTYQHSEELSITASSRFHCFEIQLVHEDVQQ